MIIFLILPKYANFNNILGKIRNGNPTTEPTLQFADLFAFAPYKKYESNGTKRNRYDQIRHKYYKLDHKASFKEVIIKYKGDP